MTAKEKADELYTLFSNAANSYIEGKKCALICVDEILDLGYDPVGGDSFRIYQFYSEVKIELKKL